MTTLIVDSAAVLATAVEITDDALVVDLKDGRTISVPLAWFPRLVHCTQDERQEWMLTGNGQGIFWPRVDEDILVSGLVEGSPSAESPQSFARWLAVRTRTLEP